MKITKKIGNKNVNFNESLTGDQFLQYARMGRGSDIDFLMEFLHPDQSFKICKMIDFALGEVSSREGQERIRFYLFQGKLQIQRNYAALYFKRMGAMILLDEAVEQGCIDRTQAYAR